VFADLACNGDSGAAASAVQAAAQEASPFWWAESCDLAVRDRISPRLVTSNLLGANENCIECVLRHLFRELNQRSLAAPRCRGLGNPTGHAGRHGYKAPSARNARAGPETSPEKGPCLEGC